MSNNPFHFPIRISAKENIPNKILDLSKYPTLNITGTEKLDDKIKHMDIVDCPFGKYQQELFNQYLKSKNIQTSKSEEDLVNDVDFSPSVFYSSELQISNFIPKFRGS